MAESTDLTWKVDNTFVPPFVSNDLKWFERDGLETWYRRNKCEEFLQDTDSHFKNRKIVNFDMIKNEASDTKIKQYQQIDHDEIKKYPIEYQQQITSSIFCNANRKDMYIEKRTINEHFNNKKISGYGRGKFIKKCKDDMYAQCW